MKSFEVWNCSRVFSFMPTPFYCESKGSHGNYRWIVPALVELFHSSTWKEIVFYIIWHFKFHQALVETTLIIEPTDCNCKNNPSIPVKETAKLSERNGTRSRSYFAWARKCSGPLESHSSLDCERSRFERILIKCSGSASSKILLGWIRRRSCTSSVARTSFTIGTFISSEETEHTRSFNSSFEKGGDSSKRRVSRERELFRFSFPGVFSCQWITRKNKFFMTAHFKQCWKKLFFSTF